MASRTVLKDAYVELPSGTPLPDKSVKNCIINYAAEQLPAEGMGDDTRVKNAGLFDWSIELEMYQDYDAEKIDSILWGLVGADPFEILIRPTSGARGADNPEYSGFCVLEGYTPISGAVGDMAMTRPKFNSAGTLGRNTTP